jgi:hypothetical protein
MTPNDEKQIKVILDPELMEKFNKIKDHLALLNNSDVLRYCIKKEYNRMEAGETIVSTEANRLGKLEDKVAKIENILRDLSQSSS